MAELEILYPEPVVIDVAGKAVTIYPVKLRHFEQYGKTAGALLELFTQASVQQINRYAAANTKQLRKLLRATTSLNRWQLWCMPSSVSVLVMAEVVRVNSGFFVEALPAVVRALTGPQLPKD
jgi:uncharacterized membrane protein